MNNSCFTWTFVSEQLPLYYMCISNASAEKICRAQKRVVTHCQKTSGIGALTDMEDLFTVYSGHYIITNLGASRNLSSRQVCWLEPFVTFRVTMNFSRGKSILLLIPSRETNMSKQMRVTAAISFSLGHFEDPAKKTKFIGLEYCMYCRMQRLSDHCKNIIRKRMSLNACWPHHVYTSSSQTAPYMEKILHVIQRNTSDSNYWWTATSRLRAVT